MPNGGCHTGSPTATSALRAGATYATKPGPGGRGLGRFGVSFRLLWDWGRLRLKPQSDKQNDSEECESYIHHLFLWSLALGN